MRVNLQKMNDAEISSAVAMALGYKDAKPHPNLEGKALIGGQFVADYCNNPGDAWPLMVENCIAITYDTAQVHAESYFKPGVSKVSLPHEKALRAAMICFLKMQEDM